MNLGSVGSVINSILAEHEAQAGSGSLSAATYVAHWGHNTWAGYALMMHKGNEGLAVKPKLHTTQQKYKTRVLSAYVNETEI